ncbi:MAG: hypothetical protein VSS75_005365 [Candidatus Parabeggiatoa sp.]|nr:hypothetical protein [Candidatus Parabeggiatoa sp.]
MIVLDEQLLGRNIELEIAKWYPGTVQFITDLRPNTVIKDDAIPTLLRLQNQPTFITINERDFWKKVVIDSHFCIVCFTVSDIHAHQIPQSLRLLYNLPEFETKTKRMGKVIRVTAQGISYYTFFDKTARRLD